MKKPIYLDYNATTPVDPLVARAMKPCLERIFGNPSSSHWYGVQARKAVEEARGQVAGLLNCDPEEIIFTSGGSESDNMAIKGAAMAKRDSGNHIITSSIEHPAVLEVCSYLEGEGFRVTFLDVDETGLVDPEELRRAITPHTILVSVMLANNEVGTIEPVRELARIAAEQDILFHTDAAQAVGKIPVDVRELEVDMLTVAGHKLYAPKGIGALYLRGGVSISSIMHGADHEQGMRAGTENVLEIVGLGSACRIAGENLKAEGKRMKQLRDRLHRGLEKRNPGIRLNGHPELRLPNTLSVGFPGIEASTLLSELQGVAASPGAACHSDSVDISVTLSAMGTPRDYAIGTVRFSVGRFTTQDEIDRAVELISESVERISPSGSSKIAAPGTGSGIKLTRFTHGLGCACKLRPQALEQILRDLPVPSDPNIMVGTGTMDDAAVYRINENTALVQTLDFFTPVVDDPYSFGAIAAANAFSDIYAMGATPIFALNIAGFPSNRLPLEVLRSILEGAREKAAEAGVSILGGHTVDDTEPKFGLAVTGLVHPDRVLTNSGIKEGDALILTKPLGTGILSTALKRGLLEPDRERELVSVMSELNRTAAETAADFKISACTDITGFGLLGHLSEMIGSSNLRAVISAEMVPLMEGARELAASGAVPGGTTSNLEYISGLVKWGTRISRTERIILCDAQTSGGLLLSVPAGRARELESRLKEAGISAAAIIGEITSGPRGIEVTRG